MAFYNARFVFNQGLFSGHTYMGNHNNKPLAKCSVKQPEGTPLYPTFNLVASSLQINIFCKCSFVKLSEFAFQVCHLITRSLDHSLDRAGDSAY